MKNHIGTNKIISYFYNELSEQAYIQVKSHLDTCSACQLQLEELSRLKEIWDEPTSNISNDFVDRVMDDINLLPSQRISTKNKKARYKPVLHFFIATAATFFIFYSGIYKEVPDLFHRFSFTFIETSNSVQSVTGKGLGWLNQFNFHISQILQSFKF